MKIIPGRWAVISSLRVRTWSLFLSLSLSASIGCYLPIQRSRNDPLLEAQVSLSPVPNSCGAISRRSCTPLCRSYPPLPITCLRVAAISIIILITRSGHGVKDNVVRASVSRTNRFYRCACRSRIFEPLAILDRWNLWLERKFWE